MLCLQGDAEKICEMLKAVPIDQPCLRHCLCGGSTTSFKILSNEPESVNGSIGFAGLDLASRDKVKILTQTSLIFLT